MSRRKRPCCWRESTPLRLFWLFVSVTFVLSIVSCPEIQLNSVTWVLVYRKQYIRDWLHIISDISENRTKVKCEPLHFIWWHIYHWQQELHLQRNHTHTHRNSNISFLVILIKICTLQEMAVPWILLPCIESTKWTHNSTRNYRTL